LKNYKSVGEFKKKL